MSVSLSPDTSTRPALDVCFIIQPVMFQYDMRLYLNKYFDNWKRGIWPDANFVFNNTIRLPLAHKSH